MWKETFAKVNVHVFKKLCKWAVTKTSLYLKIRILLFLPLSQNTGQNHCLHYSASFSLIYLFASVKFPRPLFAIYFHLSKVSLNRIWNKGIRRNQDVAQLNYHSIHVRTVIELPLNTCTYRTVSMCNYFFYCHQYEQWKYFDQLKMFLAWLINILGVVLND